MDETRTSLLSTNGLSGGYGRVPILHGIDLDVGENEVVGVLGHNGMGKTTLLKTLMGFLPATSGQVRYDQNDITRLPPNERGQLGIGYVPITIKVNLLKWVEFYACSIIRCRLEFHHKILSVFLSPTCR